MGNCTCLNNRNPHHSSNPDPALIQNQMNQKPQKSSNSYQNIIESTSINQIRIKANTIQVKLEKKIDQSLLQKIKNEIKEYFPIHQIIAEKLSCLCYTNDSLTSVAETVQIYLKNVSSQRQHQSQIDHINQFLGLSKETQTEEVKQRLSKILNDQLFFSQLAKIFRQKQGKKLKISTLSRLFHETANVKKQIAQKLTDEQNIKLDQQQDSYFDSSQSEVDGFANFSRFYKRRFKNKYGLHCEKYGRYNKHNKEQIKLLIQYETASETTEKFGQKINFNLQSIRNESEGFISMLNHIFGSYSSIISKLSYDLSKEEALQVAKIAREACEYYYNGIFFLLFYLSKSIIAQQKRKEIKEIEYLANQAIKAVSFKYPPGQTLDGIDNSVKELLKSHELKKESTKGFKHNPSPLDQNQNKIQAILKVILGYAVLANSNKSDFQDLIISTCISRSVMVKTGLKLNPDKPNEKSLLRIQEKMLFKNAKYVPPVCSSLSEVYQTEESGYFTHLKGLLEQKSQIHFGISDMVRGKCTYATMKDIIDTIAQIKQFIAKYPQKYRIIEIESRFDNPIPISDVTLKIVINEVIIAELQLTLQTNVAAYKLAHKVYEVNRCKIFSRIKKIDNDYKEMFGEVTELALRALQIKKDNKPIVDIKHHSLIKAFIIGEQTNKLSFDETVCRTLSKNQVNELPEEFKSQSYQFIATQTLKLSLCSNNKEEIGSVISQVLSDIKFPETLKAVFLYSFVKKLNFIDHSYEIKSGMNISQWFLIQFSIKLKDNKQLQKYLRNNARIHYFFGCFQKILYDHQHRKPRTWIFQSMYGQADPLLIPLLNQITNLIYLIDFNSLQPYSKWLSELLEGLEPNHQLKPLYAENLYFRSKWLIIKNQLQAAQSEYLKAKKYAQIYEKYQIIANCDLDLLYLDLIFKKDIGQAFQSLQKLSIFCKMNCIKLHGKFYVERMGNILNNMLVLTDPHNLNYIRKILQYVYLKIMEQFHTQINTWELFYPIFYFHERYHNQLNLKESQWPKQITCETFTKIDFYQKKSTNDYLQYIMQFTWKNVKKANMNKCNMTKISVEIIFAKFEGLQNLCLDQCNLGDYGLEGLLSGNEEKRPLLELSLSNNNITAKGCQIIKNANFRNLQSINLSNNSIGDDGYIILSKASWINPRYVTVENTKITNKIQELTALDYVWWSGYGGFSSASYYYTYVSLKHNSITQLSKKQVYIASQSYYSNDKHATISYQWRQS